MKTVLGIDIGGTKMRAGLVNEQGKVGQISEIPTEAHKGGAYVVSRILMLINGYGSQFSAIGIGTAGQVGFDGTILSATSTFPNWAGIELQKEISQQTQLPVRVINDAHAMALGELHFGEGRGVRHFICLTLGTGVGGAIMCDGKLYLGADGVAGGFGHMVIHKSGRSCPCGEKGCLEAYVSGTALAGRYFERTGKSRSSHEIMGGVQQGEPEAVQLFHEFLDDLACGLKSLSNIFNPEKIILAGGMVHSLQPYFPEWRETAALPVPVALSSQGDQAMIRGAASLLL